MALFRLLPDPDPTLAVEGDGLVLRAPRMDDFEQWSNLRGESRAFLEPWEPLWAPDDLTRGAFRRRLTRYADEMRQDQAYPLMIFAKDGMVLMGGLTFGNIRRGVARTTTLGYWMGQKYAGRGVMTRAVRLGLGFAFDTLGLRRVEAGCVPGNIASIRVLEANGFEREGYAREYLCIAGEWRDHILYSRRKNDDISINYKV